LFQLLLSILLSKHNLRASLNEAIYNYRHFEMSTAHTSNNIPLPHASFLAYFRQPVDPPQVTDAASPPPLYSNRVTQQEALFIGDYAEEDEETNCGFWGERAALDHDMECKPTYSTWHRERRGYRRFYDTCCLWCAMSICVIGAFGTFFALDLFGRQSGMGTGLANWMINGDILSTAATYEV
jgi:hypothetical protein